MKKIILFLFLAASCRTYAQTSVGANLIKKDGVTIKSNASNQIYVDSFKMATRRWVDSLVAGAGAGSGTVTSVATGFGLSGGTITTSGTLKADTSRIIGLPSYYYIDSLAAAIGSGGITYGGAVGGGNPNEILYIDASGNLSSDPTFYWDVASNSLVAGNVLFLQGPLGTNAFGAIAVGNGTFFAINDATEKYFFSKFVGFGNQMLTIDNSGTIVLAAIPSGGVTSIATTSPITGGTITTTGTIGINDAAADGSTKGAASFTANDFNASSGNISLDYANGQAASGSSKGFLTSADWTTFNNKGTGTVTSIATTSPITGGTITGSGTIALDTTLVHTIGYNNRLYPRTLFDYFTDAGNVGAAETDLFSSTVAANTLTQNGDKIFFSYGISIPISTTGIQSIAVKWAGANILTDGVGNPTTVTPSGNGDSWVISGWLIRVSSSVIRASVTASTSQLDISTSLPITYSSVKELTSQNLTVGNILKITGSSDDATNNSIVAKSGYVQFIPKAQ